MPDDCQTGTLLRCGCSIEKLFFLFVQVPRSHLSILYLVYELDIKNILSHFLVRTKRRYLYVNGIFNSYWCEFVFPS